MAELTIPHFAVRVDDSICFIRRELGRHRFLIIAHAHTHDSFEGRRGG